MKGARLGGVVTSIAMLALFAGGCPEPEMPLPMVDPLFPEDYATSYTMVYDCRRSIEHQLTFVRVWANDVGAEVYAAREGELPNGTVLVKELFRNPGCEGDVVGFAVMAREAGFAPTAGDWHWQDVRHDREVLFDGRLFECTQCHEGCSPPEGFDWTCVIPSEE